MICNAKHRQSGNALFLILIAVALFAALSYAITQSGRGGGSIDREQREINLAQYMQYVGALENALQKMQLIAGCSDTDISFENNITAGYINAGTPADNHCKLFHSSGGGLVYLETDLGTYGFARNIGIHQLQTTAADLVISLNMGNSSQALQNCEKINAIFGITAIAQDNSASYNSITKFFGSYNTPTDWLGDEASETAMIGQRSGCIRETHAAGNYIFIHTLIAR